MAQSTATARRVKRISGRRLSWSAPWLVLKLSYTDGTEEATVYRVEERGSDCGRSFDLWRVDGGAIRHYQVDVAGNGQNACQCRGNAYRGVCKHVEALRKLLDTGRIAGGYPGAGATEDHPADCCGA